MAKGRERHDAYKEALSRLGKELARRSKSHCELTGEGGSLVTFDLEGAAIEPSLEHVVLVCPRVADHLNGIGLKDGGLRYLETAVWSPEIAVRRAAVRILERVLARGDEQWARDALDNARLMDESNADPS